VRFWDTSALVPLLVEEGASEPVRELYKADPVIAMAWTTAVECASAIARIERGGELSVEQARVVFERLDELVRTSFEVEPGAGLRDVARRLLRTHALRAADAIQLASATLAADGRPSTLTLVTLDDRLEAVALREGFTVLRPGAAGPSV